MLNFPFNKKINRSSLNQIELVGGIVVLIRVFCETCSLFNWSSLRTAEIEVGDYPLFRDRQLMMHLVTLENSFILVNDDN